MDKIRIITEPIFLAELKEIAEERFGDMVKGVVDINKEVIALGGEMHADEEEIMLDNGSQQDDLWGINLYPNLIGDDFIEFDSMINIRPRLNNRSRSVEDASIREKVIKIVNNLIKQ